MGTADEEMKDLTESSLKHDLERIGGWKKKPDAPLGEVLGRNPAKKQTS